MADIDIHLDPAAICFPYQDDIFPGESGQGYALRMSIHNGLPSINYIKPLLGKTHSTALEARDASFLAHWFGGSVQHIAFALERIPHGRRSQGTVYAGHELGRSYFLNRSFPRVCPSCIQEHGYCRMAWELSLCVACARHRCLLVDTCPVCSSALSWGRPAIDGCSCGYPWKEKLQMQPPTSDELWLAQALDAKLPDEGDQWADDSPIPSAPDWLRLIQGLSLDGAMRVLFALATAEVYDRPPSLALRARRPMQKAQKTIAAAASFGNKVVHLETTELRPHRPSVLVDLLCDFAAASQATEGDLSAAQSLLRWLLPNAPRSKSKSRHPSLAQQVLF